MEINKGTIFGFIKPEVDVHILGMSTMANVLRDCGFTVYLAPSEVMKAIEDIQKLNNSSLFVKWIKDNNINVLAFSYRLDPYEGRDYFCGLYNKLIEFRLLSIDGGQSISFFCWTS